MKKFATILVLVFVFSVSAFADGGIPLGGKTCPQGQTCITDGGIPLGGLMEDSIRENIYYFLKFIF